MPRFTCILGLNEVELECQYWVGYITSIYVHSVGLLPG